MITGWIIFLVAFGYLGLLFGIAYYGDKRADAGRSIISNPYTYALSLAVYCTAWTFYGSVGRAASTGVGFLPIYLGPTLAAVLWWFVMRKIIRISKVNRITSIADFIASRYGKSKVLGGLVTVIAVAGIVPYISLQLKAASTSFTLLWNYPDVFNASIIDASINSNQIFSGSDTAFLVTIAMAIFAILFGTRHLDVTEHHEGMVAAIAFESVVKLITFLAVGIFVTFGLFNGFGDIFSQAAAKPELRQLFSMGGSASDYVSWASLLVLSMFAIMFLPRQFQMAVIENMDERHLNKAMWLFPLYLLLINIFVLPVAFGGLLRFPGGTVDADTFMLTLPLAAGRQDIAMLAFIGGLSASSSMVIVATVALSTMVSNDLIMPQLLQLRALRLTERRDLSGLLLGIRRIAIVVILLAGYSYFRLTGSESSLVSIGLISFAASAQFAPAILGGIYWKEGTRRGAISGLLLGFLVWGYTLPVPTLVSSGVLPTELITTGPWGIELLRPYALFGLDTLDPVSHSLFWSMFANIGSYIIVSLFDRQSAIEHTQASLFVDVYKHVGSGDLLSLWRGEASVQTIYDLLNNFLGKERTERHLRTYAQRHDLAWPELLAMQTDAELVNYAETLLSGAIGAASARVAIASVTKEEVIGIDEVLQMLAETSRMVAYSRQLEERTQQLQQKSLALETATQDLRSANERLQELDRMKDDFISTVTHELRTPLTSIRAFSEILSDNPNLEGEKRLEFAHIIQKESERLTRLINQVLDLSKLESGAAEWHSTRTQMDDLLRSAAGSMDQLFKEQGVDLLLHVPDSVPPVYVDHDRITQVVINLLSNAIKFCDDQAGRVEVRLHHNKERIQVDVCDNGCGISAVEQETIFDKFRQVSESLNGNGADTNDTNGNGTNKNSTNEMQKNSPKSRKPIGSGLGLPISRQIITHSDGNLWVESQPGHGATFSFTLPLRDDEIGREQQQLQVR